MRQPIGWSVKGLYRVAPYDERRKAVLPYAKSYKKKEVSIPVKIAH